MAIVRKDCFQVSGGLINNTHSQYPASDWIDIYRLSTIISDIVWRKLQYPGTTVWQRKTITPLPRLTCDWAYTCRIYFSFRFRPIIQNVSIGTSLLLMPRVLRTNMDAASPDCISIVLTYVIRCAASRMIGRERASEGRSAAQPVPQG